MAARAGANTGFRRGAATAMRWPAAEEKDMAEIVLGIGTSHGPMLTTPWEQWDQRVNFDKKFGRHAFKDGTYNFDQLVKLRADKHFENEITREKWKSRYEECQSAISRLAD